MESAFGRPLVPQSWRPPHPRRLKRVRAIDARIAAAGIRLAATTLFRRTGILAPQFAQGTTDAVIYASSSVELEPGMGDPEPATNPKCARHPYQGAKRPKNASIFGGSARRTRHTELDIRRPTGRYVAE